MLKAQSAQAPIQRYSSWEFRKLTVYSLFSCYYDMLSNSQRTTDTNKGVGTYCLLSFSLSNLRDLRMKDNISIALFPSAAAPETWPHVRRPSGRDETGRRSGAWS